MLDGSATIASQRVPRYTSYPTAPHFHAGIEATTYRRWIAEIAADSALSLYLHIPFCDTLCWFCGCHTKIVRRYDPVARYVEMLGQEIDLVAESLNGSHRVTHIHWGGGSPTILASADMKSLVDRLHSRFRVSADAEFAIEIDPRGLTPEKVSVLAEIGTTRASLGVQDLDAIVQAAVNRHQPLAVTASAVDALRSAGVASINIDLMYGLPHQTVAGVVNTVDAVLGLAPERLALFGYAHVPWLKRHQRLIDERSLPGPEARLCQFEAATTRLQEAGYVAIGLDHFARENDSLTNAQREGRLHRNFQGYTTDNASVLIGFGASAIGATPKGYVQNATPMRDYGAALSEGRLPTARGLALNDEDRLRRAVIERLMCDLAVDLGAMRAQFARPAGHFRLELEKIGALRDQGIVEVQDENISVPSRARPWLRTVCAVFDQYLDRGETRHARAV